MHRLFRKACTLTCLSSRRNASTVIKKAPFTTSFQQRPRREYRLALALLASAAVVTPSLLAEEIKFDVDDLLVLMKDIDQNMEILFQKLLDKLQSKFEHDNKSTKEQKALAMSLEFEALLEKVQDSVFRNHNVPKDRVSNLLQAVANQDASVTPEQAELFQKYNDRLGRMRWECTGSRKPLVGTAATKPLVSLYPLRILDAFCSLLILLMRISYR